MAQKRLLLTFAALSGLTWAGLFGLIFMLDVAQYDFWFPGRIIAYILLLVAPTFTFVPVARQLEFPLYGYWAVVSCALFGFLVAFVPTDPLSGWRNNLTALSFLLIALFMLTVTIALPIFYKLGFKLFSRRVLQYDLNRARREAVLAGCYVVLIAFLRLVGAVNLFSGVTLLLTFVIFELLMLSRTTR
jgi:hypothetical protein